MRDVVFILLTIGFFGLAYAYIAACGRLLGADPIAGDPAAGADRPSERRP